jgi:aryl-alcohol dehydrogenase-like predicted oxidoreductase
MHMPDPNVPIEESVGALEELRHEGKIRQIGVSNVFGDGLEAALRTAPVVSVQNRYSLMHRERDTEIEICEREGAVYMPWWPLAGGQLTGEGGALKEVAEMHDATPGQIALAWLLQRSPAMLPIPGTSSVEHLEENMRAADITLAPEEVATLEAEAR